MENRGGNPEIQEVRDLIESGIDLYEGDYNRMKSIIENYKESLDEKSGANQDTILFAAVKSNRSRIVDLLLKNGASPNIKDSDGKVPLNYAIHVGHIKSQSDNIISLLNNGANLQTAIDRDPGIEEVIRNESITNKNLRKAVSKNTPNFDFEDNSRSINNKNPKQSAWVRFATFLKNSIKNLFSMNTQGNKNSQFYVNPTANQRGGKAAGILTNDPLNQKPKPEIQTLANSNITGKNITVPPVDGPGVKAGGTTPPPPPPPPAPPLPTGGIPTPTPGAWKLEKPTSKETNTETVKQTAAPTPTAKKTEGFSISTEDLQGALKPGVIRKVKSEEDIKKSAEEAIKRSEAKKAEANKAKTQAQVEMKSDAQKRDSKEANDVLNKKHDRTDFVEVEKLPPLSERIAASKAALNGQLGGSKAEQEKARRDSSNSDKEMTR
jgi:hypothetical protein